MRLTHEGWSQEKGRFQEHYDIDTSRTDHEIHWKNGTVCKQISPFHTATCDWNCDGDVYPEYGAHFESYYGAGRDWYTPLELLSLMLDEKAVIPGLTKI